MNYTLKDLLDIPRLRELLDSLDEIQSMPSAIIDTEGNILTATAWQDICTKFHRINPETEKMCLESDSHISAELVRQMPHVVYRCPMGLVDSATPIIIEGKHYGNVFTGQLFMKTPDETHFIEQARRYGFDETAYLEAMRKVPLYSEEQLHKNLAFVHKLALMLAEQGLKNKRMLEATEMLNANEERHRTILRATMDGVWTFDMQGRFIEVNASYCRMSGYSAQELIGLRISDIEANEKPEDTLAHIEYIKLHGTAIFESRHRRKDGSLLDVEVSAQYLPGVDEQLVAFIRDISEHKRIEKDLKETKDRYEYAARVGKVGTWDWDVPTGNLVWNDETFRLLGLAPGAVVPSYELFLDLVHHDDREFLDTNVKASLLDKTPYSVDCRIVQKTGLVIACHIVGKVEFDSDNQPIRMLGTIQDISERKQAELELKHSSDLMSYIIQYNQSALAVHDKEMRYIYVSQRYLDDYKVKDKDIIGKHHYEVFPDLPQKWRDVHKRALEGVISSSEEDSYEREDGTVDWTRWECRPWYGSDGTVGGIIIYTEVITERKRAEILLKESEYFFKESQRAASIGSYRCDLVTGKWESSEVLDTIFGIDKEYNRNIHGWLDIIYPDDRQMINQYLREEIISKRNPFSTEYRIVRKNDGETRWVHGLGEVSFDDNNNKQLLFGTIQDITDNKQAEIFLRKSEENFRTIIELSPVPLAMHDEHGNITYLNKAFIDTTGYSSSDLPTLEDWWLRAYPDALYRQAVTDNWIRNIEEAKRTNTSFVPIEVNIACKDDSVRTFIFNAASIKKCFAGSHLVALFDITDRKKAEEERQLFEQQMQHTQKLESLGVLSSGVAHDFNNILAIIRGYCSLTKMDYETAELNIQEIEKATDRAAALCKQMLAYAGKTQLAKAKVNMWTLVNEMVTMLKSTLPQNAVIKPDLSTIITIVEGDASQIRQIVLNLIINASEAIGTEQGEIEVSLTATTVITGQQHKDYIGKEILPGRYVCLEVTDNGCGMDEETRWRIFEPFYTTKFTGRGLGMSAVLGIIKAHGGSLQLFSQIGQGSTFKVYLPVLERASDAEEVQKQTVSATPWKGSGTILLVEDEEQIRVGLKYMLTRFGFTVLEAVNGKEALEVYRKNVSVITLVLTDMGMPVMDGYALIPELKCLNPKLPIIISSGFGDADVTSRIGTDNIAGILNKPYDYNQLQEVLRGVVEST